MNAVKNHRQAARSTWQNAFVALLPEIQRRLRHAFRQLDADAREDAIAEGVIHCLLAYTRLHQRGRNSVASGSSLAWYAAKQVKRGRSAVGRLNSREPLSRYAQLGQDFRVERLQTCSQADNQWIDRIVEDKRASVPDEVAVRLDARAWLATLSPRLRRIAKDLACGYSTSEVARKHGVTAGRISQMRRELHEGWRVFQGELKSARV